MSNIRFPFWQSVRKLLVDRGDETYAERVEAYPPKVLMTDNDGPYARVRVDVGETASLDFSVTSKFQDDAGRQAYARYSLEFFDPNGVGGGMR